MSLCRIVFHTARLFIEPWFSWLQGYPQDPRRWYVSNYGPSSVVKTKDIPLQWSFSWKYLAGQPVSCSQ